MASNISSSTEALLAGTAALMPVLQTCLGHELTPGSSGDEALCGLFASRFWHAFGAAAGLHQDVLSSLQPLPDALALVTAAPDFLTTTHPVWHWLALLQQFAIGYQPGLGRGGERLLAELETMVSLLQAQGWVDGVAAFAAVWQQEQARQQRLLQRLDAAERGQLRARQAQQRAARFLNRSMAGRHLPASVIGFLHGDWYGELQWCLLTQGEQSDAWQLRRDLTERLISSLQPPDADDSGARQALYDLIPQMGPALRSLLLQRAADPVQLDQLLAAVEAEHLLLLRGHTPLAVPFELIANEEAWADSAELSSDLLSQVERLAPGDWLLSGAGERIRLAVKMDDCGQLLFVNRLAVKAGQYSFAAFAYRLAVGEVTLLPGAEVARAVLRHQLEQLEQQRLMRQRQRQAAQALAQARANAEQRSREEAKAKALAEAAALAAAEARAATARAEAEAAQQAAEAERLAQARAGERARRQRLQEGDAAQRQRRARQVLSLLAVGDWLELHDELGGSRRLKVAVKLPSSAKLILVDREGIKRAELGFDELTRELAEGAARVLSRGPQFEDTLARVVDGLRRERGPG